MMIEEPTLVLQAAEPAVLSFDRFYRAEFRRVRVRLSTASAAAAPRPKNSHRMPS